MSIDSIHTRGPYAKTAAVKRRIIDAAFSVFAESGYRATTMKKVSERAGISQRGLVHHFPGKESLLAGVLADYDAQVAATLPRTGGVAGLRDLIDATAGNTARPSIAELYAILSAEAADPGHPAHEHYRTRYETFRRYLAQHFATVREQGGLVTTMEPDALAVLFTALMDGLQSQWLYDHERIDIATALHEFLDGLLDPSVRGDGRMTA